MTDYLKELEKGRNEMNKTRKIKFTNKELIWIERTADIESAIALEKFFRLVNTDLTGKDEKEKQMLKSMGTELIDLYLFLRSLRTKLELWDARYDIDSEIVEEVKEEGKRKMKVEEMYEQHMKSEPPKNRIIGTRHPVEIESVEHIKWRVQKDNLEGVVKIPEEKRAEIMARFKQGGITVKEVAEMFSEDSMAVANLVGLNIDTARFLREESV